MNLHLHIKGSGESKTRTYNLASDINVKISEYDYVFFTLESKEALITSNLKFILGNTVINFDESQRYNDRYLYFLDDEEIKNLLLSEGYFSNEKFTIGNSLKRFSRLFINELGKCTPQVKIEEDLYSFNPVYIKSPKINDENFKLIIEYLMFNDYFDERILYKNTLDSSSSILSNSFLESLKKLHNYSRKMVHALGSFKRDSLHFKDVDYGVEEYNNCSIIDSNSLPWLIDNLSEVNRVANNSQDYSFKKGNVGYKISKLQQPHPYKNFDTYENRIILGFLDTLIVLVNDKKRKFEENKGLRSRNFTNFNDYLAYNLNNLIGFLLSKISSNILLVHTFFINELRVSSKINGFPNRLEGFLRKPHYKLFLDVMVFTQNLFAFKITSIRNFKLEIESFDKLYEVFCLYFLRDTIIDSLKIDKSSFEKLSDPNNKLRGVYHFLIQNFNLKLYYEVFPEEIGQLARASKKYHENPDFILEIECDGIKNFIIIDAKYKVYTNSKFHSEIGKLSYKYLHRIGVTSPPHQIVGLYTLSLGNLNLYRSIYKSKYDLFSSDSIYPQIGSLQLNPTDINKTNNPFEKILKRYLEKFSMNFVGNIKSQPLYN